MKTIRLYAWEDTAREHPVREVSVTKTEDLTRNGVRRIYVWTGADEEFNYTLYPEHATAYPECENRVQLQRISECFLYDAVD